MTRKQILNLIFHKDTIVLMTSIVLMWFTVSLIVDSNYDLKDLTQHKGQLVRIDSVITKITNKPVFKEVRKELRLTLTTDQKYFTSITTKDFGDITSKIATGDTVIIFTKPKLWGIFGINKSNDISQLMKGKLVVIDFEKYKQSLTGLFILTLIASLGISVVYYVRTRKRYIFDISSNP